MTPCTILHNILILLLYSDWIFFLAGCQSLIVPWFGLEMGLGSSCHSGSRAVGEYCVVLFSKELFDGHICLLECNLAANCYSPMPHTSHIFPISDVACRGTHDRVDFIIAVGVMAGLATRDRVDFIIATDVMASCATQDRVDFIIATDAMASCAT